MYAILVSHARAPLFLLKRDESSDTLWDGEWHQAIGDQLKNKGRLILEKGIHASGR